MTPIGWILMVCSLAFVWTLAIWCYVRVLRPPPESLRESSHDDGSDGTDGPNA